MERNTEKKKSETPKETDYEKDNNNDIEDRHSLKDQEKGVETGTHKYRERHGEHKHTDREPYEDRYETQKRNNSKTTASAQQCGEAEAVYWRQSQESRAESRQVTRHLWCQFSCVSFASRNSEERRPVAARPFPITNRRSRPEGH